MSTMLVHLVVTLGLDIHHRFCLCMDLVLSLKPPGRQRQLPRELRPAFRVVGPVETEDGEKEMG